MLGIRLTCPMCGDSAIFPVEKAKEKVDCGNHIFPIAMVNLAELIEIMGRAGHVVVEEEIDYYAEVD